MNIRLDTPMTGVDDNARVAVLEHFLAEVDLRIPLAASQEERIEHVKRIFSVYQDAAIAAVMDTGEGFYS